MIDIYFLSLLWILCFIFIGLWYGIYLWRYYFTQESHRKHLSAKTKGLRFLLVKIQLKSSSSDNTDNIQSMKQNVDLMNQLYKNVYSLYDDSSNSKSYGQDYIGIEMVVEKEIIKYIVAVPGDHIETFEKLLNSLYPWCVVEHTPPPKILTAGKYMWWWDFVLSKSNEYPIKTYESFEADPMDSLLSAFSKVDWDEILVLQILLSPLHESRQEKTRKKIEDIKEWKEKSWWSITWLMSDLFDFMRVTITSNGKSEEKKEEKNENKNKFSWQQSSDMDKKVEDEIFNVVIRALAISPIPERPEKIMNDLARSMNQYNYIGLNSFNYKKALNIRLFCKQFIERTIRNETSLREYISKKNSFMMLNIKELSSIMHLPHSKFNKNPRIKWQTFKVVSPPDNLPTDWMLIGHTTYWWTQKEIKIKDKDRFRHFYVIWQTGTGKSTLMITMAKEDMIRNNWFCIVDPHWELCESILNYYPKDRIDDLIYFDLSNTEYPIWFNVFDAESDDEKDVVTNDIVEMFVWMYGEEIFGPRIQDYFRNAAFLLMDQPEWWTIPEIMRLFTDPAYLEVKLKHLRNPVISARWNKTYKAMWDREKAEIIPFLQAKFWPFTTWPYIRNIIGQPKSWFNMYDAMNQKKIILCNLSKGLVWEINSQLIGRMVAIQIKLCAMKRAKQIESERQPYFLYVDECQNYISKSFESVLSEARKYKLWLVLAHQYIDQLKAAWLWGSIDLSKAIFGNVGNMFIYKVGAPDAEFLENEVTPEFAKADMVNLEVGMWIFKMSIDNQQSRPFSMKPVWPYTPPINPEEKKAIIKQIAALKRWTKREIAEKEIFYRVGI